MVHLQRQSAEGRNRRFSCQNALPPLPHALPPLTDPGTQSTRFIPEEALRKAALSSAREILGELDAQGWTYVEWAFAKFEVGAEAQKKAGPNRARKRHGEFSALGTK